MFWQSYIFNQAVRGHKTKASFPFSCEHLQTIIKLSLGKTRSAAYANDFFICLYVEKNMKMFTALMLFISLFIN